MNFICLIYSLDVRLKLETRSEALDLNDIVSALVNLDDVGIRLTTFGPEDNKGLELLKLLRLGLQLWFS